jgi:hypothetical protein
VDSEANLVSFVLRFVTDQPADDFSGGTGAPAPSAWRGVIRHVQSNEERHFLRWADAVAFISRFVPVEESTMDAGKDSAGL